MPELSLHHIDQISRDISREEISFSHLLEDLIDHVCCDVEHEMQRGLDFSEAYKKVKQKMGSGRLKEIQRETLYSVDTKYRNMKNLVKISGVAGTIMFGLAAMFKIEHWPGAGQMMSLGALFLAFIFLPSALSVLWKETHNRKRLFLFVSAFFAGLLFIVGTLFKIQHWPMAGIILTFSALSGILFFIPALALSRLSVQENKTKRPVYIIGATGIIFYALGMLFKIQHWPAARMMMVLGVIMLCVIAFPWYTWLTWKEEKNINVRFLFILIGSLLIVVPGALINLNLQNTYNIGYYLHQQQQQALFRYRYNNNQLFLDQHHDSLYFKKIKQLHIKTEELISEVNKIQIRMIKESEGKPETPLSDLKQIRQTDNGPEIQYDDLSNPFQTSFVKEFLLPGCASRQELNTALADYANYISEYTDGEDLKIVREILEPSVYLPGESSEDVKISLISGLHSLELLKNSLLTVESHLMHIIVNN